MGVGLKTKDHHLILRIRISFGVRTQFQLKQTILFTPGFSLAPSQNII